ncbi:hypothetical protein Tco_1550445 [Tanacetum coccineum]
MESVRRSWKLMEGVRRCGSSWKVLEVVGRGAAKAASGVKLGAAAAAVTAAAGATMSGSKQDAKQASK